jgi:LCP family protein required for cell wall assembly
LDDRLARVRFRRAVTLMLMTLLVPGSAQLVAGRKQVGRIALRIWLSLIGVVVFVVLLGLVWHGFVFWLVLSHFMLGVIRLTLFVLAVGWAALFVDAWRLGHPLELRQKQRLAMVGINGFLCFTVAGSLLFASHIVGVQRGFMTAMFGDGKVTGSTDGRYNVLLLGGDSGADRWGLRADSITVASIDEDTGKTVLFGLPRNMRNFPFRKGSVMNEQFPDGYDCDDCYLNSLNTFAADNKSLFTKYDDPGVEATIEAVEGITGLDINYYAMVNLRGFRDLVDAVGGVRLNVRDRIPIGGIGAPVTGYIEPGVKRLNGYQTLWFARSRTGADDYSRMARQKCVMNAMLEQLSPQVVLTKYGKIAKASQEIITTNLPASEVDRFVELALKAKSQPLATVSFVPPLINTAEPDVDLIHDRVKQAIEKSSSHGGGDTVSAQKSAQKKVRRPSAGAGGTTPPSTTGGSIGSLAEGYAANESTDLSSAC